MSCNINTKNARTLVAIDLHAKTSTLCAYDTQTGEIKKRRFANCPVYTDFISWLNSWTQGPYYFAYESGPCGFTLARSLRDAGYTCDVIAVSSIPRSIKEKNTKDDFVDAKSLLCAIQAQPNTLSCVYIPSVEAEDARDLIRRYHSVSKNLRREKQALNAFLLRHGITYNKKTKTGKPAKLWGCEHKRWLIRLTFETKQQQELFCDHYQSVERLERDLRDVKNMIDELAKTPPFKNYVSALCAIKGISTLSALAFCAEVDNFERFKNGRALASYLGLIPRRHNSGEKTSSGKITKCGDKTLRRFLIEGYSGVSNFNRYTKTTTLANTIPKSVSLEIERANKRIIKRRDCLKQSGKNHNVIKVALAKEAACQMLYVAKAIDKLTSQEAM